MADEPSLFEQAADALSRAMRATEFGEQSHLLDEALRLNRLALASEQAKPSGRVFRLSVSDPKGVDPAP